MDLETIKKRYVTSPYATPYLKETSDTLSYLLTLIIFNEILHMVFFNYNYHLTGSDQELSKVCFQGPALMQPPTISWVGVLLSDSRTVG